jgi:hypothetical protein
VKLRIIAWEKHDGLESVMDILEIVGEPFTKRGTLKGFHSKHLRRFLDNPRVSRVQMEKVNET